MPSGPSPNPLEIWFVQLQAGQPIDTEMRRAAAQALRPSSLHDPLQQMVFALASKAEDKLTCEECIPQLPDYVLAVEDGAGEDAFIEVRHHLLHCPYCQTLVDEAMTMTQAMRNDILEPITASTEHAESNAMTPSAVLQGIEAQVRKWVQITQDAIDIFIGQLASTPQLTHRAVKGDMEEEEIFRDTLDEREGITGEILIFARPTTAVHCEIEVYLYRREAEADELKGLTLRLQYNGAEQQAVTDAGGAAIFTNVPTEQLKTMRLRIPWPT